LTYHYFHKSDLYELFIKNADGILNNLLSKSWDTLYKSFFISVSVYNIHFISAFFINNPD